jgi:hypothetical protein
LPSAEPPRSHAPAAARAPAAAAAHAHNTRSLPFSMAAPPTLSDTDNAHTHSPAHTHTEAADELQLTHDQLRRDRASRSRTRAAAHWHTARALAPDTTDSPAHYLADLFTKPVTAELFHRHVSALMRP